MSAGPKSFVAFHLAGRRAAPDLPPFDPRELRPALFAGHHDLTALRYDFPLVLVAAEAGGECIRSLSGLVDDLLRGLAGGPGADRVAAHVLRLERELRALAAQDGGRLLSDLWREAAERLGARGDTTVRESLERARTALTADGEVVDCDRAAPRRLFLHAWKSVHAGKATRLKTEIATLVASLSDILRADLVRSDAGRTPASLKAAFGSPHEDSFDFETLSRVLSGSAPGATLPASRRERLRSLIATLGSQRFYADSDPAKRAASGEEPFEFVFDSAGEARDAYHARLPHLVEVARAIGMAELEARGEYDESRHDAIFAGLGAADLGPRDLARFPDYLVVVSADDMPPAEEAALLGLLSSGLPIKALVQSDDLHADPAAGVGVRQRQFATMAVGLNDVYVLQDAASQLYRDIAHVHRGLSYPGPALFSIYSGDSATRQGLPPYLVAAAAAEARVFPSMVYDPSAGPDWASRCDLESNPQVERDWPVHPLAYEDQDHQRRSEDVAFTVLEFLACDARHAAHFAPLQGDVDIPGLAPASAVIAGAPGANADSVPFVWMVDRENALARVIVDDRLIREARRCREMWHSLQELGGVHNSHAARVLARERREAEARAVATAPVGASPVVAVAPPAPAAAERGEPADASAAAVAAPERPAGEPYIETPRCSSCNECIQLNNRMFAYNENKQAYIADPGAGTFRQLVEAAESCQVAIIHPGKPRNPQEPGLEELLQRAAEFE